MCYFLVQLFSRKDSTMFRPNSSRHQTVMQHDLNCSISFDQEKHFIFGASVYTSSSYKHNFTRAHSSSHTFLITTSLIIRSITPARTYGYTLHELFIYPIEAYLVENYAPYHSHTCHNLYRQFLPSDPVIPSNTS